MDGSRSATLALATLAAAVLALGGCATLFNAKTRTVAMASTPTEAEVWVDGIRRGITPMSLDLNNSESHTVIFRKEGHHDAICELNASVGTVWVVLDVLAGLVPVVVDASTGAWKSLDKGTCNAVLPERGAGGSTMRR